MLAEPFVALRLVSFRRAGWRKGPFPGGVGREVGEGFGEVDGLAVALDDDVFFHIV